MKRIRRLAALAAAVVVVMTLSACGGLAGDKVKDDGQVYLQGLLDNLYLGQQNQDYLDLFEMSAGDASQEYADGLEAEAYRFAYTFGIDDLSGEVETQIEEVLKEAYKNAKYTIQSSTKLESGNYAMEVEIQPIDVMIRITDDDLVTAWEQTMEQFGVRQEEVTAMSDEEYFPLDHHYAGLVLDQVRANLEHVGYEPAVTVTMTLQKDDEGYYDFSQDDFDRLDAKIMPYVSD